MRTSVKGMCQLIAYEACCLKPYKDSVGVTTIGFGHTGTIKGVKLDDFQGELTIQSAVELFISDLVKYEADVINAFDNYKLSQSEFDAAVSFHYNTGAIGQAFWVKAVNGMVKYPEDPEASGNRCSFMNWSRPEEIIPRRYEEHTLFFKGEYSKARGNFLLYSTTSDMKPVGPMVLNIRPILESAVIAHRHEPEHKQLVANIIDSLNEALNNLNKLL